MSVVFIDGLMLGMLWFWLGVAAGRTTLVIAHRPSTVMLADRVALLEAGRVTAVGTHAELLRTSEHYRYVISSLEFEQARQQATEVNR